MSLLHDLSVWLFGGTTKPVPGNITVLTTATRLLLRNPDRISWTIQNRSANFGALDASPDVTTAAGFRLNGPTGSASKVWYVDGESVGEEVWAIQDTAAGTWHVEEVIGYPEAGRKVPGFP